MLRLTTTSPQEGEIVLEAHGRIADESLGLLSAEIEAQQNKGQHLVLELGGVLFIDMAGLELLRYWVEKGVELHDGSIFVQTLLRTHGIQYKT